MSIKTKIILTKIVYVINFFIPKNKKRIIFYSFPDYSDNARAIYQKLVELDINHYYLITWVVRDVDKMKRLYPNIHFVKHRSITSMLFMCRSRFIIRTHSFWGNMYIKNRQVMCVAWHGMLIKGYTKADLEAPKPSFDYFCVTSKLFAEIFSKLMKCNIERMIITGYPRNDELFVKYPQLLAEMNLDCYKKIVIWMPTFRTVQHLGIIEGNESDFGLPTIKNIKELKQLDEYLNNKKYCLLVKLHPLAIDLFSNLSFTNIIKVNDDDIPEPYSLYNLIGQTDALISDYSSVWGDYLLLNKPIGFAFDDLEEYKKARTMLEPIEKYMPGMRIRNINELINFFESLEEKEDAFIKEREKIRNIFIADCDANSSTRFLKSVGLLTNIKE